MKLRLPDSVTIHAESGSVCVPGASAAFEDAKACAAMNENTLKVMLTADQTPVKYVRLRWIFQRDEMRCEPVKVMGDQWERGYGEMEWRGIVPHRSMPWACAVSNGSDANPDLTGRFTECFGVKVRPAAMCFWQYDPKGVTLWLDVRNGGSGVLLGGRELEVCEVVFGEYREMTAFRAINCFYGMLCDDPLLPDHKVFGSNNWYYSYGDCRGTDILRDAKLMAKLCDGLNGKPYVVIDVGWEVNNFDGPWDRGNELFADMHGLADGIREAGALPGIWIRFLSDAKRKTEGILPEHRLMRDDRFLDPSHPFVLAHVVEDAKRVTEEWGYKLLKHDFTTFDIFKYAGYQRPDMLAEDGWHFFDRTKTTAEIVVNLYRTIREAVPEDTVIIGCNVIGHLAAGLVHLNRTGDDTSGKAWDRTRRYGVNTLAFRMMHHKNFYIADADCIGITGTIDWKLNREWLRALSVSGTPMFLACEPRVTSEAQFAEIREAFVRNSVQEDELEPIDWMESTCPSRWLLNGEEVFFDWYAEDGVADLAPL